MCDRILNHYERRWIDTGCCYSCDSPMTADAWVASNTKTDYTKGTTFSTTSIFKSLCSHKGSPLVFSIGKGKVFAGGSRDFDDWNLENVDLIVKLTGPLSNPISFNSGAKAMLTEKTREALSSVLMPYVFVTWEDMKAPPFGKKFVTTLVELVREGKNILVHCLGGHGRTGTLLTALAIEAGLVPPETDEVDWLRSIYCKEAVESESQFRWLRSTMGAITIQTGSKILTFKDKTP